MDSIDDIPFWVKLAAIGAGGGLFRYLRPRKDGQPPLNRQDLITHIGLGGAIGSSLTLTLHSLANGQGITAGQPAQCLIALCIGSASPPLFDLLSGWVERLGVRAVSEADKRFDKLESGQKPDGGKQP